ncbi:hypothetical protein D3C86_2220980 [compost metagenome]
MMSEKKRKIPMLEPRVKELPPKVKPLERKPKRRPNEDAQARGEFEIQAEGEGYFIIQRGVAPVESSGHS